MGTPTSQLDPVFQSRPSYHDPVYDLLQGVNERLLESTTHIEIANEPRPTGDDENLSTKLWSNGMEPMSSGDTHIPPYASLRPCAWLPMSLTKHIVNGEVASEDNMFGPLDNIVGYLDFGNIQNCPCANCLFVNFSLNPLPTSLSEQHLNGEVLTEDKRSGPPSDETRHMGFSYGNDFPCDNCVSIEQSRNWMANSLSKQYVDIRAAGNDKRSCEDQWTIDIQGLSKQYHAKRAKRAQIRYTILCNVVGLR